MPISVAGHTRFTTQGKILVRVLELEYPNSKLLEIVGALHPSGSFSRGLNRRKQYRDQDSDDGDHNQQLHECETTSRPVVHAHPYALALII